MKILGIESSCDETAAAVVADGKQALSNVIASQVDIHAQYGGVVPEIAARSHIEAMLPVVERSLSEAEVTWSDIDAIAVTRGPGLLGSLLIGSLTARTLALTKHKPLVGVDHVLAHVYANFLAPETTPQFPCLALVVSGGHTQLMLFRDHFDYQMLGQTLDDAVGEAFDKVAHILGLPYPGGPSVSTTAADGDNHVYSFPKAKTARPYDFSYSGLKTAVLRQAQELAGGDYRMPSSDVHKHLSRQQVADLAASFQSAAVAVLVDRVVAACREFDPTSVVIGGGVAANRYLRDQLTKQLTIAVDFAKPEYCTDNAAMIAALGYYAFDAKQTIDPLVLSVDSSLSL